MKTEEKVGELLKAKNFSLSTAESCTGGGIAALITSVPGSSEYFKGGIVAYSNEIKADLLHVSVETLAQYGAVSRETVVEMVKGAMKTLKTDCAVATSGIAGPGGGTPEKPVGTVWIAAACKNEIVTMKQEGDRGRTENVQSAIQNNNFLQLARQAAPLAEAAGECGFRSLCFLFGAAHDYKASLLSYEAPFGIGYAVAAWLP